MIQQGRLLNFGKQVETSVKFLLRSLNSLEPDVVQSFASLAVGALNTVELLPQDAQTLLHNIDQMYTVKEGDELLGTLVKIYEYPQNDSALVVAQNVVEKLLQPYFRTIGTQTNQNLVNSITAVLQNRNLGYRRLVGDLDDRTFETGKKNNFNGGFQKDDQRKDVKNAKVRISTESNDKDRNEVMIKELIENVKAMEAIKKYETKIVGTTAKSWPSFDEIHEKPSSFGRRANFNGMLPKNNEKSNNLNRRRIDFNFNNKRNKMTDLDDVIPKYKLKTIQNAKIKNNKESRKNNKHSGMDMESDRLYGLSSNENLPITNQNKMDRYTKHKIRNHLKHKHAKLYKSLKKRHDRNKRRHFNVKNEVLRKNKGQKRFNVVKNSQREPNFDAKDNKRPPNANKRHFNIKNRRPSDNRRPYASEGRPPSAKRRPPSANRRPPGANQLNSMYLTPRYEYNSRRFNENLNLTRRNNVKPISTELSYSNEENDIKFRIQDAIRHPIDLKSKIQQNSLIFDRIQNVRRKMAPVDRLSLKEESNYSDDELKIKSNIYKVFNKNI